MRRFLYAWLLESDLPWGLQVFWKLLTLGGAALLFYAAASAPSLEGKVIVSLLGAAWLLLGLFTKLGED